MKHVLLILTGFSLLAMTDKPAYRLYDQKLKATTYTKLLREAADADVVLFGELHNNPICHWLELQLTKDLYTEKKEKLLLGAEMFETDNQKALSDFISGRISDKEFTTQARFWPNYDTDYKPLVSFARDKKLTFVASNVPRRYASTVARQGLAALDTVPANEKQWIAPLPLEVDLTLPGYKGMLDMMGTHSTQNSHGASDQAANFARAQAIKDATMAHSILQHWKSGQTLLHFNGDYHSRNFEGIVWYLKRQRPDLKVFTIASVELEDPDKPEKESRNIASYVLAIPADMTKTY